MVENRIIRTKGEPRRIVLTVQRVGEGAEAVPHLVVVQSDQDETGLGRGIGGGGRERGEGEVGGERGERGERDVHRNRFIIRGKHVNQC